MSALTAKQLRALEACDNPHGLVGIEFWHEARIDFRSGRRTLGSLYARGLVSYDEGWAITPAGRRALADAKRPRR